MEPEISSDVSTGRFNPEQATKKKTPQEKEIAFLKSQLQGFELILNQNAELENEVNRLNQELDTATLSVYKRGYLYKYRDRHIGWASKWAKRYFSLQGSTLSYYGDETESRPRRTFDLSQCIVRNEGTSRNGNHHIFAIYLAHSNSNVADTDDNHDNIVDTDDIINDEFIEYNDDYTPALTLMLRVSTEHKAEAKQWCEMLEQGCAVQQLSQLPPGSFSPQRTATITSTSSPPISPTFLGGADLVPPKPFFIDDDDANNTNDDIDDNNNSDLSPILLKRVRSSNLALKKSNSRQTLVRKILADRAPGHFTEGDGTDTGPGSPLTISTSNNTHLNTDLSINSENNVLRRRNASTTKKEDFHLPVTPTSTSSSTIKKTPRRVKDFPAYKPMHTKSNWSPLSNEIRPGEMNYRGFFNLGLILIFLSNLKVIVDSHYNYGFYKAWQSIMTAKSNHTSLLDWLLSNPVLSIISWCIQVLIHWKLEQLYSRPWFKVKEKYILIINFMVGTLNLVIPTLWVWKSEAHWGGRMLYLFQSVIMWMKLISYTHANKDLRKNHKLMIGRKGSSENLNSISNAAISNNNISFDDNGKPVTLQRSPSMIYTTSLQEVKDIRPPYLKYPQNLKLNNILYFIVAPTLTYQLNYPTSPTTRWKHVITILFRMVVVSGLILFGIEQYIKPALAQAVIAVDELNILRILEGILKLSIPNTYVWLLVFYFYFHLWLNFCAELTKFGDREFYKDWWNSRTIEIYWRNWNLPVHNWMLRHLYYPLLRNGAGKMTSTFIVFFFSAVAHELIISVPFKHIGLHAFAGMLLQAPLGTITKFLDRRYDNQFFSNAFFWCCFCVVGQPLGIIFIGYDHWKATF